MLPTTRFPWLFALCLTGCFGKTPSPNVAPSTPVEAQSKTLATLISSEDPWDASPPPLSTIPPKVFDSYRKGSPVPLKRFAGASLLTALENGRLTADPFLDAQDFDQVELLGVRAIGATALEVRFRNMGKSHTSIWTFDSFYGGLRNIYQGESRSHGVREALEASEPAFSWLAEGLCRIGEEPLAQCSLSSGRHVALCRDAGRLRYRMGSRTKVQATLPGADTPAIDLTTYEALPETHWTLIHAEDDEMLYSLSVAASEGELNGWVSVTDGGRVVEESTCRSTWLADGLKPQTTPTPIPPAISGRWGTTAAAFLLTVSADDLTVWDLERTTRKMGLQRDGEHWRGKDDGCTLDLLPREGTLQVTATGDACAIASGSYQRRR